MRVILLYIIAIGLIWVGVLESAFSSAHSLDDHSNAESIESQLSIRRILAVGFVGGGVVLKMISNDSHRVISKGNEKPQAQTITSPKTLSKN